MLEVYTVFLPNFCFIEKKDHGTQPPLKHPSEAGSTISSSTFPYYSTIPVILLGHAAVLTLMSLLHGAIFIQIYL